MKVFETIGKGFGIVGKNINTLILLFIFNSIWNIVTFPFGNIQQTGLKVTPQIIILCALFIILNIFLQGGVLGVLKESISEGGDTSLASFSRYGKKFSLKLMPIGLIMMLAIVSPILIAGVIIGISAALKNIAVNIIVVLIALTVIVIVCYYLFLFFLSPYALAIDDVGVIAAFKNSRQFVKKNFWKVAWLSTLVVLIAFGMAFLIGILSGLISLAIKGIIFQVITGILSGALSAYITIIFSGVFVIYYHTVSGAADQGKQTGEVSA